MSDKKTKTVYLMVECEVDNEDPTNSGYSQGRRAERTIHDAIYESCSFIDDSESMRCFEYGDVAVKGVTVLPDDIKEIIERDSRMSWIKGEPSSTVVGPTSQLFKDWQESRKREASLPLHDKLMHAIIEDEKRPAIERWQDLIDRGAINEKGEVLLKGPGCNEDDDA